MLLDILLNASEAPADAADPNLAWLYLVVPALFGGYGIATIISHITKRQTEAGTQRLEGTRLGQDIMEKALLRLDKEVAELRTENETHERERQADRLELTRVVAVNGALMRYLTKIIHSVRTSGGTVPLVDPADEPFLQELSLLLADTPKNTR